MFCLCGLRTTRTHTTLCARAQLTAAMSSEVEKPVSSGTAEVKVTLYREVHFYCVVVVFVVAAAVAHHASCRGVTLPPAVQSAEDSWRLHYVTGDLFSCPKDEALAHCISEDCRMGAGIAVMFRKSFGGVDELKKQSESSRSLKIYHELKKKKKVVFWGQ